MASDPVCLVCQVAMEPGFMTDATLNSTLVSQQNLLPRWCPGEPKRALLSNSIRQSQVDAGLPVIAFRCPMCAALRLYAPAVSS